MKNLLFVLIILLIPSCAKWVAPQFTSVDRILSVEAGMSLDVVNDKLGVEPYNILLLNDSISVFEYQYRTRDRLIENIGNFNSFIQSERSQTVGKEYYSQSFPVYILFTENKMRSIITENGLLHSDNLLIGQQNILLISTQEILDFQWDSNSVFEEELGKTTKTRGLNSRGALLYSAIVPWAPFGVKYAQIGKIGGYISFSSDLGIIEGSAIANLGLLVKTGSFYSYAGAGYELSWEEPIFEFGALVLKNRLLFDIGISANLDDFEYSGLKVGLGIVF